MKNWIKRLWKPVLLLLPLVLGMIGFYLSGMGFLQSLYKCIGLYGMGHSEEPANLWVEVARWLAPMATASGIVMLMAKLRQWLHSLVARITGKSVGIYGAGPEKQDLLKQLGPRGIDIQDPPAKAHSYILMGSEEENLSFYRQYKELLQEREVYMRCQSLPAQASSHAKLHLFCPEETAARFFWKHHCPYELSKSRDHKLSIVMLGFGKLGKELLISGLQNNIFHPDQKITYTIFGNGDNFTKTYRQLSQISDPVKFCEDAWQESLPVLEQADLLLVVQQEGQLPLLTDLTLALPGKTIHVMVDREEGAAMLASQFPLQCYDWKADAMELENIIGTKLHAYAKRINLRYAHLYDGVEETEENKEKVWRELNTFTRYSNISAADYHDVWQNWMTDHTLEQLAELEHIRWCRYHFLNNWRLGQPENGKAKDPQKRIHRCLVPYADLDEGDKEKDRENIRILQQLDKETL